MMNFFSCHAWSLFHASNFVPMAKARKQKRDKARHGSSLEQLPVEMLLEILSFTASSAGVYRSLLLVSKHMNAVVKAHCMQAVPVALEGIDQLRSFDRLLTSSPKTGSFVRYLWIFGEGLVCWKLMQKILERCTGILALSCTSRTLASLCSTSSFLHTNCTELALLESRHDWKAITETPHGLQLCAQLTRLRLEQGLEPDFPKRQFKQLTHLAFACRPIGDFLTRYSESLTSSVVPSLQLIVATNMEWRHGKADAAASELLERDKRFAIVQCRETWTELDAWKDRVRGGHSLWGQAKISQKSMQVFRDAFRALGAEL
ncbi:hypothetical protein H0H93_000717 [Arthromyces matolae]|nr:hypothetical protein H0H93_000717 [Arthromyces matolae]